MKTLVLFALMTPMLWGQAKLGAVIHHTITPASNRCKGQACPEPAKDHVVGAMYGLNGGETSFDFSPFQCPSDSTCHAVVVSGPLEATIDFDGKASLDTNQGRVDRLSMSEYAKLQAAQMVLDDLKASIAKAHGVHIPETNCDEKGWCTYSTKFIPDTYEYRGQFLLVNVPEGK